MSDPEQVGLSPFMAEMRRLHQAQLQAATAEDREHANHELAHLLRMAADGRLEEYFANRETA